MPAESPSSRSRTGPRASIAFLAIGTEMASATVLGLLLDYALGTLPGFTIGLTLFGFVAVFLQLRILARTMAAKDHKPAGGSP